MSMRFVTVDTMRQARWSPSDAKMPEMTGMSAEDTAPAATSWNMRSGIRNAAKNASSWSVASAGRELPMTTRRTQPSTRETRNAPETIIPARARVRVGAHAPSRRRARGCASR